MTTKPTETSDLARALRGLVRAAGAPPAPLVLAPAQKVAAPRLAPAPAQVEAAVVAALRGPLGAEITALIRKEIRAEIARALWAERMGRKAAD